MPARFALTAPTHRYILRNTLRDREEKLLAYCALVSPKPGKERIRSVILGGVRSNAYCQKYQQWGGLEASVETIYAQEFISDEGKQNSLYWLPAENQPESPHGPLAAHASAEG
jgi:hypothetical protein